MHAPCPIPGNDERKELVRLCRAGRLYELEEWISDGKPLDISSSTKRGRQKSLLEIAVDVGFHSLVELIAKHEPSQSSKLEQLNKSVDDRERAERLRRFIAAYAEKSLSWPAEKQPQYQAWIEWATRQADRLDPFVLEKRPSVLDRKRELSWW
jgi:hypothetical protein